MAASRFLLFIGLVVITGCFLACSPSSPDIDLRTENISCAREDGTELHTIVGEVKYVHGWDRSVKYGSGEFDSIHVRVNIKFYGPSNEVIAIRGPYPVGELKKGRATASGSSVCDACTGTFEISVDLKDVESLAAKRKQFDHGTPWRCELEYLVREGGEPINGKEYKIKPTPNRRHIVAVNR